MQRYRADIQGEADANGAVPWYANSMYGTTLARIDKCPVEGHSPRAVYALNDPDTAFTIPGAAWIDRAYNPGFITCKDGQWSFTPYKGINLLTADEETLGRIARDGHAQGQTSKLYRMISKAIITARLAGEVPEIRHLYNRLPLWARW